jgi:hypothetical protein
LAHLAFLWLGLHIMRIALRRDTKTRNAMATVQLTIPFFSRRQVLKRLAASAKRKRRHVRIPPADHVAIPAPPFGSLDPDVVSEAIPAFFIGRDRDGFWVAREAKGRIGGLFLLKSSAIAFAHAGGGAAGCAAIFPAESFELDLENEGNPFAAQLAPLVRRATNLAARTGRLFRAPTRQKRDLRAS